MIHRTKIVTLILLLLLSMIGTTYVEGTGMGVGPNYIRLDSVLRNATYLKTVYIYNQNDYDANFLISSMGAIGNWATIYEMDNITKPINSTFVHNMSDKAILLKISIPPLAANGEYNGSIIVTAKPIKTNTSGNYSTVELNLPILVSMNVTGDQDLNISVINMYIEDVEINYISAIRIQFKNSGNVQASPQTEVIIRKDGMYIDRLTSKTSPIQPNEIYTQTMWWNTTGKVSGRYDANFTITIDGKVIKQKDISFNLFPPGTFTRNGTLKNITYSGELQKEKLLKIIANFINTGEIETTAKFVGEIYKDGELIDHLESQEAIVPKYQNKQLPSYLTIKDNGKYRISGYVLYGGRTTNTVDLEFDVGITTLPSFSSNQILMILGFVLIVIVLLVLYIRHKKSAIPSTSGGGVEDSAQIRSRRKTSKTSLQGVDKKDDKPEKKVASSKKMKKIKSKAIKIEDMTAGEIENYVDSL